MASKSKRRRKVLGASCILAALIIAGSSFAWFTSKDEVTNRLTATADYGVSIVEDFKPPKAMTPGENVNKDVSVVNTGSIDAFTRVALENQMTITTYGDSAFTTSFSDTADKTFYTITKTTVSIGETAYDTAAEVPGAGSDGKVAEEISGKYYLKTTTTEDLPKLYETEAERNTEKTAVEGASVNVGTPGTPGSITYTYGTGTTTRSQPRTASVTAPATTNGVALSTSESTDINTGKLTPNEVTTLQAGGKLVMAASKVVAAKDQIVVAGDDTTPPTQADYDGSGQYTPGDTGLYIFERTVYDDDATKTEYSGYYYDKSTGTFYALKTKITETATGSVATPYIDFGSGKTGFSYDSDGQISDIDGSISLLTKTTYKTENVPGIADEDKRAQITVDFGELTENNSTGDSFTSKDDPADINAVKLTIKTETARDTSGTDPVYTYGTTNGTVIYIKLADGWNTKWDLVKPTGTEDSIADYFYYKDTVKSGSTSAKLVDYVRIDNKTNQTDFVDIVYDLNVVLDSVQVTHNNEGDETATAVPTTGDNKWATPTLTTTPNDNNGAVTSISSIDWA